MADEVSSAMGACAALLLANTTLTQLISDRVYQQQAPQRIFELGNQYILGNFMAGSEVRGAAGARLMTEPLMLWRAVARGQLTDALRTIDKLMDSTLHNVRAYTTTDSYVISIVRETPYYMTTRDSAGNALTEIGGMYRAYVRAL